MRVRNLSIKFFFSLGLCGLFCLLAEPEVFAQAAGTVQVYDSTFSDNNATIDGGAIYNYRANGTLILVNSTFSGNNADTSGGAISNEGPTGGLFPGPGEVRTVNVTITNNTSDTGGGIASELPAGSNGLVMHNTIVAGNTAARTSPDISGTLCSGGYNLIGDTTGIIESSVTGCDASEDITGESALLDPLGDNGGTTETHELQLASPAVDAGNPADPIAIDALITLLSGGGGGYKDEQIDNVEFVPCVNLDQRGTTRAIDGDYDGTPLCDIGALEATPPPFCGDGYVNQAFEECDDGTLNSDTEAGACRTDCTNPFCGDGVIDTAEFCDDSNAASGDGCSATCTVEFCGDGILQEGLGEACDGESICNLQCQVLAGDQTELECTTVVATAGGGKADVCTQSASLENCEAVEVSGASGAWLLIFPFSIFGIRRWYEAERS